jgi:hypothetical protein
LTSRRVPVAVRGWIDLPAPTRPRRTAAIGDRFLVFDCESNTTPDQALTFGGWRYCIRDKTGALRCIDEGLFHADDLPVRDPAGFITLQVYAQTARADLDTGRPRALRLLSRTEFVEQVFYRAAYRARATVVGFNLPFDLSRIALWTYNRRGEHQGFSLSLWQHDGTHNRYRPLVRVRHMTRHFSFISFSKPVARDEVDKIPDADRDGMPEDDYVFPGHFLDLRTLGFALTNIGYSLDSAAKAFGCQRRKTKVDSHGTITPSYIDYCRDDVAVTAELAERMLTRYQQHPIDLPAPKAFSPASLAKAYLRAMNVTPVLTRQPDFPQEILGAAMQAFYGGRAECRLRRVTVPIELVDFTSMYPTVDSLLGIWELLTARRIEVIDATEDIQQLLDSITVRDCFNPAVWRQLVGLAWIQPTGDALPVRGDYLDNGVLTIGIQHLTSPLTHIYALPDVVASKLLTGKALTVLRAVRLIPAGGPLAGLRPTRLSGAIDIDPRRADFFREIVRARLPYKTATRGHPDGCGCEPCVISGFLKVLANAGSYGIFAEINPKKLPARQRRPVQLWTGDTQPSTDKFNKLEVPGEYCFPPTAAVITAAARLMLAILETLVTEARGSWVFCDTDSMAILAAEHAGTCPRTEATILSYDQVATIRDAFTTLDPYGTGSILDTKHRARCHAISAKRYALFTPQ